MNIGGYVKEDYLGGYILRRNMDIEYVEGG
jgi:hypothetical protein